MSPFRRSIAVLGTLAVALLLPACTGDGPPPAGSERDSSTAGSGGDDFLSHVALGREALGRDDLAAAAVEYGAALALAPDQPALLWRLARIEARRGDVATAVEHLRRLVAVGATADPLSAEEFAGLRDDAAVRALALALEANAPPRDPVEVHATFEDVGLWPEGIAWDAVGEALYVGSLARRGVVRVTLDGRVEPLGSTEPQAGLQQIVGLWVDAGRRTLWAASNEDPAASPAPSELVRIDLAGARGVTRYPVRDTGETSLLNDVVATADGTAWVTESNRSALYRLPPGADTLLLDRRLEGEVGLNGIAVAGDGTTLYLAHMTGITVLDTLDGAARPLAVEGDFSVAMADGVGWHDGALYLVQNQDVLGQRVVRVRLDATGRRATGLDFLPSGWPAGRIPYTCAVGAGALWVVVAADFSMMGRHDVPPPLVARLPLGPRNG